MDTLQISQLLYKNKYTRRYFGGVFPSDKIPVPDKYPVGYVVNEDASKLPGTHWIGIFVKNPHTVYYFDSYGQEPVEPIKQYLSRYKNVIKNKKLFQALGSDVCGLYAISFIYLCSVGKSIGQVESIFSSQPDPDKFVVQFVNKHF